MGTQGTGRKRSTKKERSTAEDDALNLIAREAEARLAAKRAARAEAREIRMRELERQQKELSDDDERMSVGSRGSVRVEDRDYLEKGSRAASSLTAATLTSLGGTSSRRGSGETAITVDAETSIREIKDALAEVEEKYRKAMVSNAQLDNEKNNLMYQVDTLKDSLMELEELLSESQRSYEEKVKEFEREKHAHSVLQFQFNEMKETLKQSEELLNEIRLLRIKQEGFVREVSDLQETVEWKDKKIAALERQKEYTDAIRIERDELREEVVKLKDILKKHGIVLGPDLNINGDVGEAEVVGSPSADAASQPAPDAQTPPTEGNSLLGITEETRLRSSGEEEVDPEQHQEMFEEAKENHLSSDSICDVADVSTVKTAHEEKPTEEQQTCSATEEDNVQESCLSKDLSVLINDDSVTETKDETDSSPGPQGIEPSSENKVPEAEKLDEADSGEAETKSSGVDSNSNDITESSNNILEEQENKQEEVAESNSKETESAPQQESVKDVVTKSLPGESVRTVSNAEPQQEPESVGEVENDEEEETSSKTQPQAAASGKKKRKKRKGKKKGGANENKNQQKDGSKKEKEKTGKDVEPAAIVKETTTEPEVDGSVIENLKESKVEQDKNEKVMQDEEQTLETCNAEEVETTTSSETFSNMETQKETSVDHLTDNQNKEQSVEAETVEAAEVLVSTESSSQVETLKESRTDPNNDDEQDQDRTLETEKVEEVESVKSPVPEVSIITPELIDDSKDDDDSHHLDKECMASEDISESGANISTNGSVGHAESEAVDGAKDEDGSAEEMKSECTSKDHETSETNSKEVTEVESHVPSNGDIANDDESEVIIQSESEDTTPASPSSTDGIIDHLKSSSGSEPSELSAAVNSGSDDAPDQVSDKDPEETTETVKDDEEPAAETEQESFSSGVISPRHDEDEKEELNGDSEEPEGLAEPEISSHAEEKGSFDGGSLTENTDAVDTEKSPLEVETQAEQLDEEEIQTLDCEHQTAESNVEGSLETEVIKPVDMLNEPDSPKESTETGSCVERDDITEESAVAEDQEHKNSENDQQSETHLPVEEPSHESSRDEPEVNDSSQPTVQASDEEDEEDDEGQSFDFEDMDVEVALAANLPNDPKEEEVEEGVEVMSDEGIGGCSGLCQSNTESNEHEPGENNERCTTDEVNQVDTLDEGTDTISNEEDASEKRENVCEKQESVSKEEVAVADEPVTEEGKVLIAEEMGDVAENINQAASLPADKGSDVVKNESQGGDLVLPKSSDQVGGSKEPPQTRADGKKNGKKGKAKGKEECKMS